MQPNTPWRGVSGMGRHPGRGNSQAWAKKPALDVVISLPFCAEAAAMCATVVCLHRPPAICCCVCSPFFVGLYISASPPHWPLGHPRHGTGRAAALPPGRVRGSPAGSPLRTAYDRHRLTFCVRRFCSKICNVSSRLNLSRRTPVPRLDKSLNTPSMDPG